VTPTVDARPSVQVEISIDTPEHLLDEPLLSRTTIKQLTEAGIDESTASNLLRITKGYWGESSNDILDEIEKEKGIEIALLTLDVLSMCDHGNHEGAHQRLHMAANQAHEVTPKELIAAISSPANTEEFFTWMEEEGMPSPSDREDWMLYLHPEQEKIAFAELSGPVRLRGVSGSGKTSVLVHRARHLAKKYNEPVLVVSLTNSMKKLLEELIIALCGAERNLIRVATVSGLAKDVVRDIHPEGERWYTMPDQRLKNEAMEKAVLAVNSEITGSNQSISRLTLPQLKQFLEDEFGFIRTRLIPSEYSQYTLSSFRRAGRGQALAESARHTVLKGLLVYEEYLRGLHKLDDEGVAQIAVEVIQKLVESLNCCKSGGE